MVPHRSTHYWLWFLLFGMGSAMVAWAQHQQLSSESIWLLGAGLGGVLVGSRLFSGALARPYDLLAGLLFGGVGLLGILHNLGMNLVVQNASLPHGVVDTSSILGLSLSLPYALIHAVLGLTSLNHGLAARPATPTVMVGSSSARA
jgi:hypothetical protein